MPERRQEGNNEAVLVLPPTGLMRTAYVGLVAPVGATREVITTFLRVKGGSRDTVTVPVTGAIAAFRPAVLCPGVSESGDSRDTAEVLVPPPGTRADALVEAPLELDFGHVAPMKPAVRIVRVLNHGWLGGFLKCSVEPAATAAVARISLRSRDSDSNEDGATSSGKCWIGGGETVAVELTIKAPGNHSVVEGQLRVSSLLPPSYHEVGSSSGSDDTQQRAVVVPFRASIDEHTLVWRDEEETRALLGTAAEAGPPAAVRVLRLNSMAATDERRESAFTLQGPPVTLDAHGRPKVSKHMVTWVGFRASDAVTNTCWRGRRHESGFNRPVTVQSFTCLMCGCPAALHRRVIT